MARPALSWGGFEAAAPDFAGALHRRLHAGIDGVAIAYLATVSAAGHPHLSPVCPIFCGDGVYVIAGAASPKTSDLRATGRYVLHAFQGANDEETQVAGPAHEVLSQDERLAVHAAVRFAAFKRDDPIFALGIERALWTYWENVAKPDTRPVRRRWVAR